MSAISNHNIAQAIYLTSKGKTHEEGAALAPLVVKFLAKKKLLSKAPDILARLNKMIHDHEGKVVAKVSSVTALDSETNKALAQTLASRYKAKEIILEEKLDESLLGGFKVEVNDEVIDLSMKNKIGKLQEYLMS